MVRARGDSPRGAAVVGIIVSHLCQGGDGVLEIAEWNQAAPGGKKIAEAGVLQNDRASGRQITGAAIAEPAATGRNVPVFRDTPFAGGAAQIILIRARIAGDAQWIDDLPAAGA